MSECTVDSRLRKAMYPRTCPVCGLGPCQKYSREQQHAVADACREGKDPREALAKLVPVDTKDVTKLTQDLTDFETQRLGTFQPAYPSNFKILICKQDIETRVQQMGKEVAYTFRNQGITKIVVVPVMTGAMIFCSDLVRQLSYNGLQVEIIPITVKSYTGVKSGEISVGEFPVGRLADRPVLLVEDILDTGQTLKALYRMLLRVPYSRYSAVLLDKNKAGYQVSFTGFHIPDEFVIGYGLDYNSLYRELPDIRIYQEKPVHADTE